MGTARRLTTTAMRSPCITCSTISVEFIRHCAALQQWKPDSAITFGRLRKWYFWRDNVKLLVGALLSLALAFGVLCAIFRVNLWTLTYWSTRLPSRSDDSITTLGKINDKNPN